MSKVDQTCGLLYLVCGYSSAHVRRRTPASPGVVTQLVTQALADPALNMAGTECPQVTARDLLIRSYSACALLHGSHRSVCP